MPQQHTRCTHVSYVTLLVLAHPAHVRAALQRYYLHTLQVLPS
jgi:hypothetical protein